ncbi:hypothetical protein TWF679_005307 [Orbilia oligospora]|uniref:Uncharacterized protein n=1 Tax=Orbilia oligospora TaxID=2813651 RepID=A0A8H8VCF7_ORBOL|nr:hypothetical protein TWF679_005307 [Orbilia oligospora]
MTGFKLKPGSQAGFLHPGLINDLDYADIIATVGTGDIKLHCLHRLIVCPRSIYFYINCNKPEDEVSVFKEMRLPDIEPFEFNIAIL